MSLSKLNHDCFLAVLGSSSLSRQLALRQVCLNWCTTIEAQLHRQQSLALFFHFQPDLYGWCKKLPKGIPNNAKHALFVKHYSFIRLVMPLLIRLFPAVKNVLLSLSPEEMAHPYDYLNVLSTSLSSLAILHILPIEWSQLVGIHPLKRLFLKSFTQSLGQMSKDSPDVLKVMSRLEYFATEHVLLDALHHLGPNIQWIQIHDLVCFQPKASGHQNLLEALWPLPKPTRDRLEHLSITEMVTVNDRYAADKVAILQSLLRTMPNLKSFHFLDHAIPLKVLASKIVVLQKLKELSVSASAFGKATKEGFHIHQCAHLSSVKIVCVEDYDYRDYRRKMSQLRYNQIP